MPIGQHSDAIALRIVLDRYDGPALEKEWTWAEVRDGKSPRWIHDGPPLWLKEPEMIWRDPSGPIVVRGLVPPGNEDLARALIFEPPETRPRP